MTRDTRQAQNELWFRELNERLEQKALVRVGLEEPFEIVCECAREECTERIPINAAEYETVREVGREFILRPGHSNPEIERVIARTEDFEVVKKVGEAGEIAELENPRG